MEEEEKSKSLAKLKNKHEAMITDLEGKGCPGLALGSQELGRQAGLLLTLCSEAGVCSVWALTWGTVPAPCGGRFPSQELSSGVSLLSAPHVSQASQIS